MGTRRSLTFSGTPWVARRLWTMRTAADALCDLAFFGRFGTACSSMSSVSSTLDAWSAFMSGAPDAAVSSWAGKERFNVDST